MPSTWSHQPHTIPWCYRPQEALCLSLYAIFQAGSVGRRKRACYDTLVLRMLLSWELRGRWLAPNLLTFALAVIIIIIPEERPLLLNTCSIKIFLQRNCAIVTFANEGEAKWVCYHKQHIVFKGLLLFCLCDHCS